MSKMTYEKRNGHGRTRIVKKNMRGAAVERRKRAMSRLEKIVADDSEPEANRNRAKKELEILKTKI